MPSRALQRGRRLSLTLLVFLLPVSQAFASDGDHLLPDPSVWAQRHEGSPAPAQPDPDVQRTEEETRSSRSTSEEPRGPGGAAPGAPRPSTLPVGSQPPPEEPAFKPVEFERRLISKPLQTVPPAPPAPPSPPAPASPPPPPGTPFPIGELVIGPEARRTETHSQGTSKTTYESAYNLGIQQLIPSIGVLNAALSWADDPEFHGPGSFFVQLQGLRALDRTVDVTVGDTFVIPSLLSEDRPRGQVEFLFFPRLFPLVTNPFPLFRPEEQFSNFFPPSLSFEGGRLDVSSPTSHYLLFGGRVSTLKGFTGNIADVTDESIVGAKVHQKLGDRLLVGAGYLRTEGSLPLFDGSMIREDNTLLTSIQYRVTPSFLVQGEYGFSIHNASGPFDRGRGTDFFLIAGPVYRTETFFANLNYQRIGTEFQLFKRFAQADREGVFLNTGARPWPWLNLFGTFERSHNNLDRDPRLPTIDTTRGLLGGIYILPTNTLVSFRGEATAQASRETDVRGAVDTIAPSFQVEVGQPFLADYRALLRYRRDFAFDRRGPDSSAETVRGEVTALFRDLNLLLAGEVNRQFDGQGEETRKSFTTISALGFRLSSFFDGFVQFSWIHELDRLLTASQNRFIIDGRVRFALPFGFALSLDLNHNLDDRGSGALRVTGQLIKSFVYGSVPPAAQFPAGVGRPAVPPIGTMEGFVLTEPTRQGVANIRIVLDGGPAVFTDAQGRYSFPDIAEGEHTVRLDLRKLPAMFALIGDPEHKVTVQARGVSRLDFPVALLGWISGRVMNDANRNGRLDPDEGGQAGVRVLAVRDQEREATVTELDGTFLFDNLKGGSYTLQLDPAFLPEGTTILPTPLLTIPLEPGGEVKDRLFLIQLPARPEIRKEF